MNTDAERLPVIALAMGDPAGISPELTAKLAASDDARNAARLVIIGDKWVFDAGDVGNFGREEIDGIGPAMTFGFVAGRDAATKDMMAQA